MKEICFILTAVLLLTALIGCQTQAEGLPPPIEATPDLPNQNNEANTSEPIHTPEILPDSVFSPKTPGDPYIIREAALWVREQQDWLNTRFGNEVPDPDAYAVLFSEANSAYKRGDNGEAISLYLDIIYECPTHRGAINNVALAYMHWGWDEEALKYCILNRVLNPSFYIGWVNLLVAGHSLGFRPSELQVLLEEEFYPFHSILHYIDEMESDMMSQDSILNSVTLAYYYNLHYANMEYDFDLYGIDLDGIWDALLWIAQDQPDDKDVQLLMEYFLALRTLRERQGYD
jgi:hypothetical protein